MMIDDANKINCTCQFSCWRQTHTGNDDHVSILEAVKALSAGLQSLFTTLFKMFWANLQLATIARELAALQNSVASAVGNGSV